MKRPVLILAAGGLASLAILGARWAMHEARGEPPKVGGLLGEPPRLPARERPGDPLPDVALENQDSRPVSLEAFRGKPLLLSFLYTRCNVASMCPAMTRKLQEVQALARKQNLEVHFLVVSFDPSDRPETLRAYARLHGVDLSNWDFATGPNSVLEPLARAGSMYYRRTPQGGYEHNLAVSLIDARGRLRDEFLGGAWSAEELVEALSRMER